MQFRQGDVLISAIDHDPRRRHTLRPLERRDGKIILAYGEATGHAHAIVDDGASLYGWSSTPSDGVVMLQVTSAQGARVVHEEHDPILLPPGWYEVRRQREYSPGSLKLSRFVAD